MKPIVYLAGPISGLSYQGCTEWRDEVASVLAANGLVPASPMRHKEWLKDERNVKDDYPGHFLGTAKGITTRDRNDVCNCDLLLVNFLGATKVSIGTVMEIAWADLRRIPIVVAMENDNIHQHGMLNESAGFITSTLKDAVNLAISILDPLTKR